MENSQQSNPMIACMFSYLGVQKRHGSHETPGRQEDENMPTKIPDRGGSVGYQSCRPLLVNRKPRAFQDRQSFRGWVPYGAVGTCSTNAVGISHALPCCHLRRERQDGPTVSSSMKPAKVVIWIPANTTKHHPGPKDFNITSKTARPAAASSHRTRLLADCTEAPWFGQ